jgi:putative membrane protein
MDDLRNWLANYMDWILAGHIIAVIAFMAGMLYLPRLFVYHTGTAPGSEASETFKVMETKLLKAIINPALIAVWILGPTLAWITGAYLDTWLHVKFALVILLSALHGLNVRIWRSFQADRRDHDARYYRIVNEIPALLMVLIVLLVVIKPFGG